MKKIIMDYCLLHQMNTFGPNFFWFSCTDKKLPFWQFFRIFKNCQNGTFLPVHENQNFFGPKVWLFSKSLETEKAKSSHFDRTRGDKYQIFPTLLYSYHYWTKLCYVVATSVIFLQLWNLFLSKKCALTIQHCQMKNVM